MIATLSNVLRQRSKRSKTTIKWIWIYRMFLYYSITVIPIGTTIYINNYFHSIEEASLIQQQVLIAQQKKVIEQWRERDRRLVSAARHGDLIGCKKILYHYPDPNVFDEGGQTPLVEAVKNRENEVVKYLLDNGADPNLLTSKGNSALEQAITSRDSELIKLLVSKGASLVELDNDGDPPLAQALVSSISSERVFDILIKLGANPNGLNGNRDPIIFWAISNENEHAVKKLISAKADLNTWNAKGESVYSFAENNDKCREVYGFELEGPYPLGYYKVPSPYCTHSHKRIFKMLIAAGARPIELEQQINTEQRRPFGHLPWILQDALDGMY
ncbi:MAG: ankyrin repeat domain-containing protein [Acidobacteriota bacterium]